ncbi:MAG: pilus assembly protein [Proteobacteria bacterium]|nr:pilus assembly protein [Pseudomonadota bacterium]
MSNLKAGNRRQTGQGMVEYIVIVGLVAIGAAGLYSAFGNTVHYQTTAVTNALAGQGSQAQEAVKQAGINGNLSSLLSSVPLGLDDYAENATEW